jgi:micrococcal nuclease
LGIWADPDFALLSGDERRDFSARAGTLTLIEGRISSIGHTAPRLYLNFGGGRGGLSLTIARRNQPLFERAGLTEKNLLHKTLRARGMLEIGAGPQIELFHPNQIEFMEDRR